jgi:3-methyl-2-oxobutanoate hydroxymethyltransferase
MSAAIMRSRAFRYASPQSIRPATFAGRPFLSQWQTRNSSHSPMGAANTSQRKKVTLNTLRLMHRKGDPITMITAHDFPSASVADAAGMDTILVGDSLAMVALGMEDTSEVLMEEMLLHCRSVSRAAKAAFTVGKTNSDYTSVLLIFCNRLATCQWARMR